VTPSVAGVGRNGGWPMTGRTCASCAGSTRCTDGVTGREPVMTVAGTTVAAARLAKLLMVMLRLTMVTLLTFLTLTCRK
jgi:hypothetical protein